MDISEAKQQIERTVEAYLRKDESGSCLIPLAHQRPMFVLGAPGIGKTAIMEQVSRDLGIGLVAYSMTHHTRQSALGLPQIERKTFDGRPSAVTEYTMSEIVSSLYEYMEETSLRKGILFLDEINCVSETLHPSMLQFLQFKTFGKHRIPADWVVVCAGNPPEYNRSVNEFDIVTLDRLRKIEVEPDYRAWRRYALQKGLHPCVLSFLESKQDCFYRVEGTPEGGKAFVTARGWEDLAHVMAAYETAGYPLDRDLFAQFINDAFVLDQFSAYYQLFKRYQCDYRVADILSGEAGEDVMSRARNSEFDERIAVIGLILDSLARECASVLESESVLRCARDVLREAKPELLGGGSIESALLERVIARDSNVAAGERAGVLSHEEARRQRRASALLRELAEESVALHACEGERAFSAIENAYLVRVKDLQPASLKADLMMDAAFDFAESCYGAREMLAFMAELSTRQQTTLYISRYGNERYYEKNQDLQVDAARMGLTDRVSTLLAQRQVVEAAAAGSVDTGGAAGMSIG